MTVQFGIVCLLSGSRAFDRRAFAWALARMRYVYARGVPRTLRPAFPEAFPEIRT